MKKIIAMLLIISLLFVVTGCGSDKKINGVWFETKGLVTNGEKNPCVHYDVIWGNVFWSVVLSEMIIFPIYFVGWSIFEPKHEEYDGCFKKQKSTKLENTSNIVASDEF